MLHEPPGAAKTEPLPNVLNLVLCVFSWSFALALLWAASRAGSVATLLLYAIAFSFVGNTIFSLLHESVHGLFHPNRAVNEIGGILCAAFFPTGLSVQRVLHLGHHRRNRTELETFDYYYPEDNRFLKTVQWYGIISGIYWIVAVLGWLVYLFAPFVLGIRSIRDPGSALAEHTSGPAYVRDYAKAPPVRARLELVITLGLQLLVFHALDLTVTGWLCCYLAFGLNWSALQYADHAFSPLHVVEGAWDLRVHPLVQSLFLNYHLHLAHHRNPTTPWYRLPSKVDKRRYRPSFLRMYARMWRGPRPAPGPPAKAQLPWVTG